MAEDELKVVALSDAFYRDGFGKVIGIIASMGIAIALLILMSLYLHLNKPAPVVFHVDESWHVQPPVPVDQPYRSVPELLQWVSETLPNVFVYDFNYYNTQLQAAQHYFTSDGWNVFLNQLNIYVNYNTVQSDKLFVNGYLTGAPVILNQGLLSGRYAWWVQVPIVIASIGNDHVYNQTLTLQVLVVRVPTLDNLAGVSIDNVIVAKKTDGSLAANG
jgi:intracellular multiplication protein IcmL